MAKLKKKDVVNIEENESAALKFKALGDPTRLSIVQYLAWQEKTDAQETADEADSTVKPSLVTVGDIALFVTGEKKITSTVSHHLKELRQAGLIRLERSGKKKFCYLQHDALQILIQLLVGSPSAALKENEAAGGATEIIVVPNEVPVVTTELIVVPTKNGVDTTSPKEK